MPAFQPQMAKRKELSPTGKHGIGKFDLIFVSQSVDRSEEMAKYPLAVVF